MNTLPLSRYQNTRGVDTIDMAPLVYAIKNLLKGTFKYFICKSSSSYLIEQSHVVLKKLNKPVY